MNPFDPRVPRVAFQPPSDMGGPSGGSSKSQKLLTGLGIGCGVVMLIIGILFAAGAFKAISCCNDVKNVASASIEAKTFAETFAAEVHAGKLDEAYVRTSAKFKETTSADAFKSAVEAHRARMNNNPRLFNMQLEQHGGDNPSIESLSKGAWLMSFQFAGPKDETMLLLNFRVLPPTESGELSVEDVRFEERARNLNMEPPAIEVARVHELIQKGQYELAYTRLGDGFRAETNLDAWKTFLNETGPALTASSLEVREVSYNESNTQATVMVHAKSTDGKNAIVQFELQSMQPELPGVGWRVAAIAPLIGESADTEADPVPAEEPDDKPEAGTTGAEPDVKPPEVKVDVPG